MIPIELLDKNHMISLEDYKQFFGDGESDTDIEKMFYETFLIQTDSIISQIVEGTKKSEDYLDELQYREFARQELLKLEGNEIDYAIEAPLDVRTAETEAVLSLMLGENSNHNQASEQLRKTIQLFAQTLTDEQAMEIATIYPAYEIGKAYAADELITYGTNSVGDPQLYRVVQAHTSQADWSPDATPALYTPIGLDDEGYPVWSQPAGEHDAYDAGDIVNYNGTLYKSLIDGNVWSPDAYPAGWEEFTE